MSASNVVFRTWPGRILPEPFIKSMEWSLAGESESDRGLTAAPECRKLMMALKNDTNWLLYIEGTNKVALDHTIISVLAPVRARE